MFRREGPEFGSDFQTPNKPEETSGDSILDMLEDVKEHGYDAPRPEVNNINMQEEETVNNIRLEFSDALSDIDNPKKLQSAWDLIDQMKQINEKDAKAMEKELEEAQRTRPSDFEVTHE